MVGATIEGAGAQLKWRVGSGKVASAGAWDVDPAQTHEPGSGEVPVACALPEWAAQAAGARGSVVRAETRGTWQQGWPGLAPDAAAPGRQQAIGTAAEAASTEGAAGWQDGFPAHVASAGPAALPSTRARVASQIQRQL